MIPAGIPSDVLKRRPDIAEAEREMASSQRLVRAAYASFFPSLTLTAFDGYSSPIFKYFLTGLSRWWYYGENINQTIFDGGRKYSILQLESARFYEADGAYQQLVLTAFQEVEDALASIKYYAKEEESMKTSVVWAKKTYQISYDRYIKGVTFYLDVVDSERDELTSEILLNAVNGARFVSTIQLIKALGGGWGGEE